MDKKRRRSNRASGTDLPREITARASNAFSSYLNRRKRSRPSAPEIQPQGNQSPLSADELPQPTPVPPRAEGSNPIIDIPDEVYDAQQLHANHTSEQHKPNLTQGTNNIEDDHDGIATLLRPEIDNEIEAGEESLENNHEESENNENTHTLPSQSQHDNPNSTANNPTDIPSLVKHLKKGLKYTASWSSLLSFITVTGRTRFPKAHYKVLQEAIETSSHSAETILSYSSTRENQNSYFNNFCFPKSNIHYVPCDNLPTTLAGTISTVETAAGEKQDVRECVKVVPVSSWAKFDISLHPTYGDIIDGDHHNNGHDLSIERSAIVHDREHFIGSSSSFWALHEGNIVNVDPGTIVNIPVKSGQPRNTKNASKDKRSTKGQSTKAHSSDSKISMADKNSQTADKKTASNKKKLTSADETFVSPRKDVSPLSYEDRKGGTYVRCKTGPQWCVTSPQYTSPRCKTVDNASLSADEQVVYNFLKVSNLPLNHLDSSVTNKTKAIGTSKQRQVQKQVLPTAVSNIRKTDRLEIYPTDVCAFLRPAEEHTKNCKHIICVLVSSFVSSITDLPSERIVWIHVKDSSSITAVSNSMNNLENSLQLSFTLNVTGVPEVHKSNNTPIRAEAQRTSSPKGKLDDGTDYVVYRFALYADEFGFDGVCGVYILLLGASQHNRISSAGVRVLSLVPKVQDVNKILDIILDDILRGMIYGIQSEDPAGNKLITFLDMSTMFGDYVKMAAITNTAGHSATCFCTHCRVPKSTSNTGPSYASSALTHSRRMSFIRLEERQDILLNMGISDKARKQIGLKTTDFEKAHNLPLVRFSDNLLSLKDSMRTTSTGNTPVSNYFDSCLSTAVAPDHNISGLILVLIEACFRSLPNNIARISVENYILQTAVDNSLPTEGRFLKFKDTTFDGIASMTMSTLYVILLVATPFFDDLKGTDLDTQNIFHIVRYLQGYVSTLYYWPDVSIDNADDFDFYTEYNGAAYFKRLRFYAVTYTTLVAKTMLHHGTESTLTDRPNSHRLIELAMHTIPLFGHGKIVSELVLELTHAFFKGWFRSNNHCSAHITGIDLFSTRIWSSNVFILHHMWKNGETSQRSTAFNNLFKLFFGEVALRLYTAVESDPQIEDLVAKFRSNIDDLMRPPVGRLLLGSIPIAFAADEIKWVPRFKLKAPFDDYTKKAFTILASSRASTPDDIKKKSILYQRAALTTYGKYNMGSRTYPYKTIYRGTPICFHVQNNLKDSNLIEELTNGHGHRLQSIVLSVFTHDSVTYVTTHDLTKTTRSNMAYVYKVDNSSFRVIRLAKGIVRLGYVYSGIDEVVKNTNTTIERYSGNCLINGHSCHLLFRVNGYPPCLG